MTAARREPAPAKVNLTLRVLARRPDGYHDIESLVAFAGIADELRFTPGRVLVLAARGPTAPRCGDVADNLVVKAAHALAARVSNVKLGRFLLFKRLPVAAGLGGGSSDAAAALRLLARANRLSLDDPRVTDAARATGADVRVCLDPQPRVMRGIGDVLSQPLALPSLPAVLVNAGVMVATQDVFRELQLRRTSPKPGNSLLSPLFACGSAVLSNSQRFAKLIAVLTKLDNDLQKPAIGLVPIITDVLRALASLPGCQLARMSGSGATCFGLFATIRAANLAARRLRAEHADWWVRATVLGS